MFAGIFSCTPSFSPEINKVYLILSYYLMCLNIVFAVDHIITLYDMYIEFG